MPASTVHDGMTYGPTGPAALTLDRDRRDHHPATGRRVRYDRRPSSEAYASRAGFGAPDWQVDAWVSTYTAIAAGELAGVTDDVALITGHPPMSLEQLLGG